MRKCIFITLVVLLGACNRSSETSSDSLFGEVNLNLFYGDKINLDNVFAEYRIIPLETNDECLIGGNMGKVVKKEGKFFIQSYDQILIFDVDGKYLGKIDNGGSTPNGYGNLLDFDIVPSKKEILVSGTSGFLKFSSDSFEFKDKVKFPFFVNKFKYIGNDKIIAKTPEDKIFKICDLNGIELNSFYDKNPALSGNKIVQFIKQKGLIISQFGNSNQAISYDTDKDIFNVVNIVDNDNSIETIELNSEYYEKYGHLDFKRNLQEKYTGISSFREFNEQTIIILNHPHGIWSMITKSDQSSESNLVYFPMHDCKLINNLVPDVTPLFYNTLISTDSDDSFLFCADYENDMDNNPVLLEVFKIK